MIRPEHFLVTSPGNSVSMRVEAPESATLECRPWPLDDAARGVDNTLPPEVAQGICPACLLRAGLEPASEPPGDRRREVTLRLRADASGPCAGEPGAVDRLDSQGPASRHGDRRCRCRRHQAIVRRDARAGRAGRPLPALRRDRPRRHGGGAEGPRHRPGPRPGRQGLAGEPPARSPSWCGGSSRRRRSAASSSIPGSCRCTSWAPSPTAGPTSP